MNLPPVSSALLLPIPFFLLCQLSSSSSGPSLPPPTANRTTHFQRFVSRQRFPIAASPQRPTAAAANGQQLEDPAVTFQANCSVPMCEGQLAPIFCSGPMVSSAWYFGIQQQCPGSRLRHEPNAIMKSFKAIIRDQSIKKGDFLQFCEENFENIDYLRPANLTDWRQKTPNFEQIKSAKMKKFATALHQIWPKLTREFVDDVQLNQDRYPVLSVPHRFVVPGGFFKVYFYWDTFWILKGLYFSGLVETAHGMLMNFAHVLQWHGFIPNSGNIQLSRRSQPPLFTQMIADYFAASGNRTFLAEFLPYAEKELSWWKANRSVQIEQGGQRHSMFQYKALTDCPRPENFLEDYQLGVKTTDPRFFWSSTASACESGLDFSARWYRWGTGKEGMNRKATATDEVLPVDLNVFMALNYGTMAKLYRVLDNQEKAAQFAKMAAGLGKSIDRVFFDRSAGAWFDYDLFAQKLRKQFYPSNIYPLLLQGDKLELCGQILLYLRESGALGFKGGIPSSLESATNEQWDFPNGWAPQQHLFVLSLLQCAGQNAEAAKVARQIANSFLTTTYNGLFSPVQGKPAQIWEKYDVRHDDGVPGFGGEYPAQSGFGWTNGVILEFIRIFYTENKSEEGKKATIARRGNNRMDGFGENGQTAGLAGMLALETVAGLFQTPVF